MCFQTSTLCVVRASLPKNYLWRGSCHSWTQYASQQATQCRLLRPSGAAQQKTKKVADSRYTSGYLPARNSSNLVCNETLGVACETARLDGLFMCAKCVGHNEEQLENAGCSSSHTSAFCNNLTCVPSLFGECQAARNVGLAQCVACVGKNKRLLPTVCTNATEKVFCSALGPGAGRIGLPLQ